MFWERNWFKVRLLCTHEKQGTNAHVNQNPAEFEGKTPDLLRNKKGHSLGRIV